MATKETVPLPSAPKLDVDHRFSEQGTVIQPTAPVELNAKVNGGPIGEIALFLLDVAGKVIAKADPPPSTTGSGGIASWLFDPRRVADTGGAVQIHFFVLRGANNIGTFQYAIDLIQKGERIARASVSGKIPDGLTSGFPIFDNIVIAKGSAMADGVPKVAATRKAASTAKPKTGGK